MNFIDIRKYAWVVLGTAMTIGMTSCTDESRLDNRPDKGYMDFSAQVGNATSRATESTWYGNELIGVKKGETVKTYHVATDGKMTAEGEPYQWEGVSYELSAWTPLTEEQIVLTDQTTEEKLFACDLLASNAKAESKNVHFTFSHKMTRMWWELQKYEGYTMEEVNAAKVSLIGYKAVSYTEGEITTIGNPDQQIATHNTMGEYYRNGEAMMVPCEMWERPLIRIEIGGDTYVYTPSKGNPNDVAKKTGDLLPNTCQRYYLSVSKKGLEVSMKSESIGWDKENIGDGDIVDAKFKVAISDEITGLESYQQTGMEGNGFISNPDEGFSIIYKESNSSGGIAYEGSCDRNRTVNNDGTVTFSFTNIRSDIKLAYTQEYMELGYYFYNDGTYGAEYNGNAVGVIYKIGKHDTDEPANYDGTGIKNIHGYVVALADEVKDGNTVFQWNSNGTNKLQDNEYPENGIADGHTSRYIGYLNTQYIINRTAAAEDGTTVPAAAASTTKNSGGIIQETSGWYLPSRSQLVDVAGLAGLSFDHYVTVDGVYWTSSFDGSAINAYVVQFGNNGKIPNEREFYRDVTSTQKVRLILTF